MAATKKKPARKVKAPAMPGLSIEYVPRADLKLYGANAREHSEAQIAELARSMERFGWTTPILIEGNGTVIAGHGRLAAAALLEIERVPVVRLEHLSPDQARALRLADNRLAELATWNDDVLAAELRDLHKLEIALDGIGWNGDEIAELVGDVTTLPEEQEAEEVDETPAFVVTEPGDEWTLGKHRVVCGDSLKGPAVDRALAGEKAALVLTDPPYAIYGSATGVSASVTDDKIVRPFFRAVMELAQRVTPRFAHAYIFCDWRSWPSVFEAAKGTRMEAKNLVVWEKNGSGLGSFYANTYELAGFFAHCPPQKTMRNTGKTYGHRSVFAANVIKAQRPRGEDRLHNTAKPVDLLEQFVRNSSDEGALVLEPFGGSGSTLIACEIAGRRCATVEIEPAEVDKIVRRWQKRTGGAATNAAGKSFDEIAKAREKKKG